MVVDGLGWLFTFSKVFILLFTTVMPHPRDTSLFSIPLRMVKHPNYGCEDPTRLVL
jgi:isoprenylcysteine carboxyl methyltransferase (ICMT) family protein YpbQ